MKTSAIFSSLLISLSATGTTLAADCSGVKGSPPNMAVFWTAREVVCGCYGNGGTNCNFSNNWVSIQFSGAKPSTQLCWNSLIDILNQCIQPGWKIGIYIYGGTTIKVEKK